MDQVLVVLRAKLLDSKGAEDNLLVRYRSEWPWWDDPHASGAKRQHSNPLGLQQLKLLSYLTESVFVGINQGNNQERIGKHFPDSH